MSSYTYPAQIQAVQRVSSSAYSAKGESEQAERLQITVAYDGGGATDEFRVGAEKREEFIVGRKVEVVLQLTENV